MKDLRERIEQVSTQRDAYKSLYASANKILNEAKAFVCSYLGYKVKDVTDADEVTYMSLVVDLAQRLKDAELHATDAESKAATAMKAAQSARHGIGKSRETLIRDLFASNGDWAATASDLLTENDSLRGIVEGMKAERTTLRARVDELDAALGMARLALIAAPNDFAVKNPGALMAIAAIERARATSYVEREVERDVLQEKSRVEGAIAEMAASMSDVEVKALPIRDTGRGYANVTSAAVAFQNTEKK